MVTEAILCFTNRTWYIHTLNISCEQRKKSFKTVTIIMLTSFVAIFILILPADGVMLELYSINWMLYSKEVNRSVLIMKENLKQPLQLMAAGISPVNLEMFTSVSPYLNLLNVQRFLR